MNLKSQRAFRRTPKQIQKLSFNFQTQKQFIQKEKQWLSKLQNSSSYSPYTQVQNKKQRHNLVIDPLNVPWNEKLVQIDQQLAKTIKHHPSTARKFYRQNQPVNVNTNLQNSKEQTHSSNYKQFVQQNSAYNQVKTEQRIIKVHQKQKPIILSIDEIKQVERQIIQNQGVHKITSSASRKKLRTNSSKDSRSSIKNQIHNINPNPQTQRYSKYMPNQLASISIDLRKGIIQASKEKPVSLQPLLSYSNNQIKRENFNFIKNQQTYNQLTNNNKTVAALNNKITSNPNNKITRNQKQPSQIKEHNSPYTIQHECLISQRPYSVRTHPQNTGQNCPKQKLSSYLHHEMQIQRFGFLTDRQNYNNKNIALQLKSRSRSNLSKYSQLKQHKIHNQPWIKCQQSNSIDLIQSKQNVQFKDQIRLSTTEKLNIRDQQRPYSQNSNYQVSKQRPYSQNSNYQVSKQTNYEASMFPTPVKLLKQHQHTTEQTKQHKLNKKHQTIHTLCYSTRKTMKIDEKQSLFLNSSKSQVKDAYLSSQAAKRQQDEIKYKYQHNKSIRHDQYKKLTQIIDQNIKKKPIRLTLSKRP